MALPSNTLATYEAVGNREDLADIIYDVTPTETPYLSSIPKGSASSTKHEWLTRSLAAAVGTNAKLEGDDATTDAANANVRVYNYCQISSKTARVSGTQESVDKAGMKSVMAREMSDKMKELKRDVETVLLQDVAYVSGGDTTARKSAGLSTYIKTNIDKASDGTAATGNGSDTYTEGTARVLSESSVEACLATAWSNGGQPSKGFLNAFQKRKFASFSGNSTRTSNGDGKRVVNAVDVYIDPLGNEVSLVPCRQMPTDRIYFVDPDYVKFCPLQGRNFQSWDLAKTGDSMQKQILVEYTQEVCNEKAHAAVYDLTTS
jgi:hypothetical protein